MTSNVIDINEIKARMKSVPPNPLLDALDALALALVEHGHVWTDRERSLYETAFDYLNPRL